VDCGLLHKPPGEEVYCLYMPWGEKRHLPTRGDGACSKGGQLEELFTGFSAGPA